MIQINVHERAAEAEPIKGLAAGLIAGLAGTIVMTAFQNAWTRATDAFNNGNQEDDDDQSSEDEPATAKAADRMARGVLGAELSKSQKQVAGQAMHYGFGTVMGGMYGVMAEYAPKVTTGAGLPFGAALMLGADEVAVAALGLSPPPQKVPASTHLYALAAHLVYGATTEAVRGFVRRKLDDVEWFPGSESNETSSLRRSNARRSHSSRTDSQRSNSPDTARRAASRRRYARSA